jgi:hypothetical protein
MSARPDSEHSASRSDRDDDDYHRVSCPTLCGMGYSSAPSHNAVATQHVPRFRLACRQSARRVRADKGGVPSTGCMAVEQDNAAQPSEMAH